MVKSKKKKEDLQKELLKVSKKHLEVSEQHKDIGRQQLKQSMSLREKRAWQLVGILTMIIIGGGGGGTAQGGQPVCRGYLC